MNYRSTIVFIGISVATLSAQDFQRRATMRGGEPGRGKCTIEVVVDGAAEIDIRGDSGVIRNLAGQPATWRRFECTGPLPANPVNFRFAGVDGRGRQQLLRDPRSGGVAVVRIEDPQSGAEGYTFDLFWENRDQMLPPPVITQERPNRGFGRATFAPDDAVRVCRESIRQQASDRFRTPDVEFRRIAMDDNPGRNDWVMGTIVVRGRDGREDPYRFSCSVDFESGRVRSATIESPGSDRNGPPPQVALSRETQNCQRAIEERLRTDGYDRIEFRSISAESRGDRQGQVTGWAEASRRDGMGMFDFSCTVDGRDGDIRSVDVRRRGDRR